MLSATWMLTLSAVLQLGEGGLKNPDFELDRPGAAPSHWDLRGMSQTQGYQAKVSFNRPFEGKSCLLLESPAEGVNGFGIYGRVTQRLSAVPFRGQRVRYSAALRLEAPPVHRNHAALWLRVVRPDFQPAHWTDQAADPVRSPEWRQVSVVVDVAPDAEWLEVGFTLSGAGSAFADAAQIEAVEPAGGGNEPPRALSPRSLNNLVAFSRLVGYVRYFHPSDESAASNWEQAVLDMLPHVEPAISPADLAQRLTEAFAHSAPALQVFPSGASPPLLADLSAPPAGESQVVAWRHDGVATNGSLGVFKSERVVNQQLPGRRGQFPISPESQPKPAEPFLADLGGGVTCRVPLALYADAEGTRPRALHPPLPTTKPSGFPLTGDDRTTRLAGVILAWSLLQHFYPYFDVVETDWPGALGEALTQAAVDPDAQAYYGTLRRLLSKIQDSHGMVRGGSGTPLVDGTLPLAWDVVEGKLVVVQVDPAAAELTSIGDLVTQIDGVPSNHAFEQARELTCGATPQARRFRALQDLRNGPAGSKVSLRLARVSGTETTIELERRAADDAPLRGPSLREPRLPTVKELKPDIWYVDLDRLQLPELTQLQPKLNEAEGIAFDLRGYPTIAGYGILQRLLTKPIESDRIGQVITRLPDRQETIFQPRTFPTPPAPPRLMARIAFITDGRAVSAAENYLSQIANHQVAPIVGEATAGSNGGVNLYFLPGGYRISWTGQKVVRLDGTVFHGVGVRPTHPVQRTLAAVAEQRDEALEQALQLVDP
ncbi:MAG: S41 family peptidase [Planctomycetales bacterium]